MSYNEVDVDALLAAGPPAVNWDGISASLEEEYRRSGGRGSGALVEPFRDSGVAVDPPPVGPGGAPPAGPSCTRWVCLVGRNVTADTVASGPPIIAGTTDLPALVATGGPWLTFSAASVAELNRMGIDEAFSVHGTLGRAVTGAIVYRGTTDTGTWVNSLCKEMFLRFTGPYKYVTTWTGDASTFAEATRHLAANGGRVCGAHTPECQWCSGTGRLVYPLPDMGYGTSTVGSYCMCSKGEWLEVRDDERDEWEYSGHTAHLMGWPSGSLDSTPERRRTPERSPVNLSTRCGGSGASDGPVPSWESIMGLVITPATVAPLEDLEVGMSDLIDECQSPVLSAIMTRGLSSEVMCTPGGRECDRWLWFSTEGMKTCFRVDEGIEAGLPDGFCYQAVIYPEFRGLAASELGLWPTIERLATSPARWFSLVQLTTACISALPSGRAHIGFVRDGSGSNFFENVVSLARRNARVGAASSFAGVARAAAVSCGMSGTVSSVTHSTLVGADNGFVSGGNRLRGWLANVSGVAAVKFSSDQVHVVSNSAALLDQGGRRRLRVFEAVGDSALTLVVALRCQERDESVEAFQSMRRAHTANTNLTVLFNSVVPDGCVAFAGGVDPHVGTVGAKALESLVGLVCIVGGMDAVHRMCDTIGLLGGDGGSPLPSGTRVGGLDPVVTAVVMPPGHGKSYRHGVGSLREADVLCPPRRTPTLGALRTAAKRDPSKWREYLAEWGSCLRAAAVPGDVVMVPDFDVAEAAGFCVVGAYYLAEGSWLGNMRDRDSAKVEECRVCYESVARSGRAVLCNSNAELDAALSRYMRDCAQGGSALLSL